jgi:hypothetical protein
MRIYELRFRIWDFFKFTNKLKDFPLALIAANHLVVRKAGKWITDKSLANRFKKLL